MFDGRTNLARQVAVEAKNFFGESVFETVIPRNVKLSESPSFGKPIFLYDSESLGAKAYLNLASELVENNKKSMNLYSEDVSQNKKVSGL
jgi:chromosome partitioning protein